MKLDMFYILACFTQNSLLDAYGLYYGNNVPTFCLYFYNHLIQIPNMIFFLENFYDTWNYISHNSIHLNKTYCSEHSVMTERKTEWYKQLLYHN